MISVVIPTLNEKFEELKATVDSIHRTASTDVEVVVVDDCSSTPVPEHRDYHLDTMKYRVGGGAARHHGAIGATGSILVFTDSHCRFSPGWDKAVIRNLRPGHPGLLCGRMLALDHVTDKLEQHRGEYYGGKMVIRDPEEKLNRKILASKWRPARHCVAPNGERIADTFEVSALMGACYAVDRDFFFRIGGMSLLYGFGCEEEFLSMKTLLAGGDIIWVKDFCVGHRFRGPNKPPYRLETWELYYNTMVIAHTCCPPQVATGLLDTLGNNVDIQRAKNHVRQTWNSIANEANRLHSTVFRKSWTDYLDLLKIIDG